MLSRSAAQSPLRSLRSPLPLLLVGLVGAALLIAVVSFRFAPQAPSGETLPNLSTREALTLVAEKMRSGTAAEKVLTEGSASFRDGAWYITVGDAQFHFTTRHEIVVADNQAAQQLEFGSGG